MKCHVNFFFVDISNAFIVIYWIEIVSITWSRDYLIRFFVTICAVIFISIYRTESTQIKLNRMLCKSTSFLISFEQFYYVGEICEWFLFPKQEMIYLLARIHIVHVHTLFVWYFDWRGHPKWSVDGILNVCRMYLPFSRFNWTHCADSQLPRLEHSPVTATCSFGSKYWLTKTRNVRNRPFPHEFCVNVLLWFGTESVVLSLL